MEDSANGPVFRANKRRKVFRKRADSNASGDEPHVASTTQGPESTASPANGTSSTGETHGYDLSLSETTRVRRPKKHGIAFSSSDASSSRPHNNNEETALVVSDGQPQDVQNERFARQTGRTVVADDKHMSAYIDSKLAEMRSKTGAVALNSATQSASHTPDTKETSPSEQQAFDATNGIETAPLSPPSTNNAPTNKHSIQATTNLSTKRRQPRPRRAPSPSTLARASLIDQIMGESNHTPHYTTPTAAAAHNSTSTSTQDELDPDAAAAAAFKADFLAQAEARNLSRRKPKVPAATTSGAAAAGAAPSSGPKLGGSRAARMRMREAEEAKAKK